MLVKPLVGVVGRFAGRDDELPIRALSEQHRTSRLGEYRARLRTAAECLGRHGPVGVLERPETLPRPRRQTIEPVEKVPILAPRARRELNRRRAAAVTRDVLAGRHRPHAIRREPAIDVSEKIDAFEPPVPKELRVEGGGHDAVTRLAAGAHRRGFSEDTGKMVRVGTGGGLCSLWVVLSFGAEVDLRPCHAPQPQAVGPANLVELEIPLVAGIALRTAPDLSR